MSVIELRGVAKWFGATPVLADVDLVVPDGSVTAVLGASGSGKTTLLRLIAGLEHVDAGTVAIGGRVVDDGTRSIKAQHRGVGYVPQEGALFPHLTVMRNISFGVPRQDRARAGQLLDLVGLGDLGRRYPHQLSGGQQQRVALARALAIRPRVVLLDEPFSSLDASLRTGLRRDVARVLAETGTTTVLVTHDQDEALALADQIAVLRDGRVVASDDPHMLYRSPPDVTAATSIGDANVLLATVEGHLARCALGAVRVSAFGLPEGPAPCQLLLRPEQLVLHSEARPGTVVAVVTDVQFHGHDTLAEIVVEEPSHQELLARVPGSSVLAPGQTVWVGVQGAGRAWALDDGDRGLDGSPPVPSISAGRSNSRGNAPSAPRQGPEPIGSQSRGDGSAAPRRHNRRHRRRMRTLLAVVALALGLGVTLVLTGGGPSPSAVGPVAFHARIETTGRVHLSDSFTDTSTAKRVSSCVSAAENGDAPSIAPKAWYAPTPPLGSAVEIEVGTIAQGYRGPGHYPQSAFVLGAGVLAIGSENYNLASTWAKASMTVDADGSGVVNFTHAPGDDDVPGPGWHGGISGTITWTCTS